ncbi:hypothetical protein OSB04_025567 [Centaurea solstitialis]|uniref:RING-type E3 ubiquitin transferase n=1 Tax=Centaurea solstitialis TaxID=347529 RepID=A0AA38T0M2_9ASTR|nr:hypothetical protein OSB04_025567 [Centaurea solstitialis]
MPRLLLDSAAMSPPEYGGDGGGRNQQHGTYNKEANVDTNMVIILAALLCALICALGINSIVRCALRCGRRLAFEGSDAAVARLAATGVKKRALRRVSGGGVWWWWIRDSDDRVSDMSWRVCGWGEELPSVVAAADGGGGGGRGG